MPMTSAPVDAKMLGGVGVDFGTAGTTEAGGVAG